MLSIKPTFSLSFFTVIKRLFSSSSPSAKRVASFACLLLLLSRFSLVRLCVTPPGSAVPGILQARTLEWVTISFSNAWKWKVKVSRSVLSDSLWPHGLQPTRLLRPWDFPGKSSGVGCYCLLHCISEVIDISPGNLDSSLCFIQPTVSHDVLCI